ncbi:unnamed protein product, partial [Choristocarpus tenellus]
MVAALVPQCDVIWCGRKVGQTLDLPRGLPTPRWEGAVFYLPIGDIAATVGTRNVPDDSQSGYGETGTAEGGLGPLLVISVNSAACTPVEIDGDIGREGEGRGVAEALIHSKGVGNNDWEQGESYIQDKMRVWAAMVSGRAKISPWGQTSFHAGDILSVLGSLQTAVISCPTVTGQEEVSSTNSTTNCAKGPRKLGLLRFLLNIEKPECTRNRMLVSEVVDGILCKIIDSIPGQVARIELRILGLHPYNSPLLSWRGCPRRSATLELGRGLCLRATWNGESAASTKLSGYEVDPSNARSDYELPQSNTVSIESLRGGKRLMTAVTDAEPTTTNKQVSQVMLPLSLPDILLNPGVTKSPVPQTEQGMKLGSRSDHREDPEGLDPGGKTHCLRVDIGRERQSGEVHAGRMKEGNQEICLASVHFFERDLFQDDWTELHVPI